MTGEADKKGFSSTSENDSRIIPIGQKIRKYKIDELTQLFNVLIGDMSLVGPRPLLIEYLNKYSDYENNRHLVKPGITGLAQVTGFDMSNPEKLSKIDKIYYDKKSVKLDFQILICTLSGLFRKKLMLLVKDLGDV